MVEDSRQVTLEPSEMLPDDQYRQEAMTQPGAAAAFSFKQRRLFPLPLFACPPRKLGTSRSVRQRRDRICRAFDNCNEVVRALNWLAGESEPQSSDFTVSAMQQQVLSRVEGLVFSQKPSGDEIMKPEEALKVLLRGGSPYDMGVINDAVASYQSELVSVPQDCRGCPDLRDVLPTDDRQYLEENSELMLRPKEDRPEHPVQPYWDPKLRYNRKAYHGLVRKLNDIGYFTYTLAPLSKVGVFFVWKSNRTKLRLITDCRPTNEIFREAPGVSLTTAEGFGRIEVELEDDCWGDYKLLSAVTTYVGLSDVRDCFHRMRVPAWLSRYFAWESVPASVLNLEGTTLEGKLLGPRDAVFPCAGSLCQGFSWSLYFAQRANENVCRSVDTLQQAVLTQDRGGPVVLRLGKEQADNTHFYVYVDNLGVLDTDAANVELAMQGLQQHFNSLGLELHASEVSCGAIESLGCILDGSNLKSAVNPKRLWKVHQALTGLLGRGRCSGQALEKVVGHCTFCSLMNRRTLVCFSACYAFIHARYNEVATLWPSVRKELEAFRGCLFLLSQDWWRQWNRNVTSSDSSLGGFGCCHAWWPKTVVAKVGRVQERSRFKRSAGHSARESALTAAGFHYDGAAWGRVDHVTAKRLCELGWEVDSSFEEVPARFLGRSFWTPRFWGKWKHAEPIGVLEARTVLKCIKRLALTRFGHDLRHLHLCDNLGVVLCFERSRSKSFKLLRILREFSAYCLARNIHVAVRWIPSELNISDEPSRIHDENSSKLLVDLLDDFVEPIFSPRAPLAQQNGAEEDSVSHLRQQPCDKQTHTAAAEKDEDVELGERCSRGHTDRQEKSEVPRHGNFLAEQVEGEEGEGFDTAPHRISLAETVKSGTSPATRRQGGARDRDFEHYVRAQGRAKRKEEAFFRKAAKKAAAALGGCPTWNRNEFFGSGGNHQESQREIQQKPVSSHDLSAVERLQLFSGSAGGYRPGEILRDEVHGRRRKSCGRLCFGGALGSPPGVWKEWLPQDPSCMESSERLEETMPIEVSIGIPSALVVRRRMENDCSWTPAEGSVQPPATVYVPQAQHPLEVEEDGTRASDVWSHGNMEHPHFVDRDFRHIKDWDERRCGASGFTFSGLHRAGAATSSQGTSFGSCLDFHVPGIPGSVQSMRQGLEGRSCSVPSQTFGTKHRLCCETEDSRGDSQARKLGKPEECDSVREGREAGSKLEPPIPFNPDGLQVGRAFFARNRTRPRLPPHSTPKWGVKGQYVADFFAGSGRVARAVRRAGFTCREWEILTGPDADLTRPAVLQSVKFDIDKGRIIAAMLAPPCSSFSVARDRTMVIRSKLFPWGLPDLPPHEQDKIRVGNCCIRSTLKIISWLDSWRLPWILENPYTSKVWYLPPLQQLMKSEHVHDIVCDFCMFGTPWRKRTRFLCGNIDPVDLGRIDKQCVGTHGCCSRTGRRHVQLTGSHKCGIPMTRHAQPYPHRLCHGLAHALVSSYIVIPSMS